MLEEPGGTRAHTVSHPQQCPYTEQAVELAILKQFTFSSELQVTISCILSYHMSTRAIHREVSTCTSPPPTHTHTHTFTQRMSVLVSDRPSSKTPNTLTQCHVYVKGAPETIESLCTQDSGECFVDNSECLI